MGQVIEEEDDVISLKWMIQEIERKSLTKGFEFQDQKMEERITLPDGWRACPTDGLVCTSVLWELKARCVMEVYLISGRIQDENSIDPAVPNRRI